MDEPFENLCEKPGRLAVELLAEYIFYVNGLIFHFFAHFAKHLQTYIKYIRIPRLRILAHQSQIASARTETGCFTETPVDISICHLHVSQSQATKSGPTAAICSKSGLPMAWDTS